MKITGLSNKIFEMFIININLSIYLLTSFNANNMPRKDFMNSVKWKYKWTAESRKPKLFQIQHFCYSSSKKLWKYPS